MAIYELRQYRVRDGKMQQWLELMEGEIMPFLATCKVTVAASFCALDDPNRYVWIRRFEDEADLKQKYRDVYESDHWLSTIKPRIGELIIREEAVVDKLSPTALSVLQ